MTEKKITATYKEGGSAAIFSPTDIQLQLKRILDSEDFKATEAQRAFLKYVVEKTLAGKDNEIKGYTVATEVLGRRQDFDQATDPIVSIQANKLRRELDYYYLASGGQDPIHIEIPKGTYVPVFKKVTSPEGKRYPQEHNMINPVSTNVWPMILVESFANLTGDKKLDYVGIGIATEIALEITRYQELRVIRQVPDIEQQRVSDSSVRFVLGGVVKKDIGGLKVIVNLVDMSTGIQIWGDSHHTELDPSELILFEERVAVTVVGKIACEDGVIVKNLSSESKRIPPLELKTYQAILRFYNFLTNFSPETFIGTFKALEQACKNEPECGLVWSMLARLYCINFSMELFAIKSPLEKAVSFAEKGVSLDPTNQRVRTIRSFVLLFENELSAGLAEAEYARKLNPGSLICMDSIGYLITLFGDWQRGPALIKETIRQNPYYNISVRYALWVDWVRQQEYEKAYKETLHFRRPALFWEPLMQAVSLGLLGRTAEAIEAGKQLLKCKPDFAQNGEMLIRYYIKFDDIVDRVLTGLREVGVLNR